MTRPRPHTVDAHRHDHYELCLVFSGEAEHVVNGVARPPPRRVPVTSPWRAEDSLAAEGDLRRLQAEPEVCDAAGFPTLSHVGRACRRRYGTAPPDRSRRPGSPAAGDLGAVTM